MELDQLLDAITQVTLAVARIPCAPQDKREALDSTETLFARYRAVLAKFIHLLAMDENRSNIFDCFSYNDTGLTGPPSQSDEDDVTYTVLQPLEVIEFEDDAGADALNREIGASPGGSLEHKTLQEKMQSIDMELDTVKRKIDSMEKEQRSYEFVTALNQMKHSQEGILNRVDRIENRANDLELLQNRIEQINALVGRKYDQSTCAAELSKLHKEITSLKGMERKALSGMANIVAFSASAMEPFSHNSTDPLGIQFRNVSINFCNCFDPESSKFKSKFVGLYLFSTSINTNSVGDFEAAIVHNDEEVAYFGTPGGKDLQTGTSIVLQLQIGDTVCVKATPISNPTVEIGAGFSNFIGFKIA